MNWANAGNAFLGSGAFANNFNTETAPDIIGKLAFDPGWGHYEVLGMVRFFTDNVFTCSVVLANGTCPVTVANVGSAGSKITVGEGVGGSVLLPVIPKLLDVQASALYGKGIGRYGTNQLSDVVVGSDGTLSPITALHVMAGAVAHPWAGLDIYGYGGFEKANSSLAASAAGITGFGNPTLNNNGCGIITAASFTGGVSNCAAVNKEVDMATVGFWQNIYKGSYGRMAAGLQYEYIVRKSFDTNPGLGGPVSTNDNVFLKLGATTPSPNQAAPNENRPEAGGSYRARRGDGGDSGRGSLWRRGDLLGGSASGPASRPPWPIARFSRAVFKNGATLGLVFPAWLAPPPALLKLASARSMASVEVFDDEFFETEFFDKSVSFSGAPSRYAGIAYLIYAAPGTEAFCRQFPPFAARRLKAGAGIAENGPGALSFNSFCQLHP